MDILIPLFGLGSLLIIIILLVISIIGLILRKSWAKKGILWSIAPLAVLIICVVIDRNVESSPNLVQEQEVEEQSKIVIDFDEFKHEVSDFTYNKDDNSIDIELSTNIPDGTKVDIGFTKMFESEEGIKDFDDPIVNDLSWEREEMKVHEGKINLHYVGLDEDTPLINGKYGVWLSFEVDSLVNGELYEVLESIEDVESRFKANILEKSEKTLGGGGNKYSIILGQEYLDITNSISYNDLKKQQQEQIAHKKANAKDVRFAELEKNPDKHYGEFIKYRGEVLQIMEDETSTVIRLGVTKKSYGYSSNDVVYVTYTGTTPFVKEDIVTVYGPVKGSHTYESQAGYQITLPLVEAEFIE
ncbi:hypothetical protein JSQ81_16000 [Sporosarcina sp. Marseille-Q4063]|uniref:hypothetical protein n=1 Tax=Sporosarcina sp. Marseille-Q4063 TaxID=2810514 RepID=UPI001BAF739C|nr:hypothetical protein [Sporosarcina sp. Marseille-Q4063]QUW21293.1 hypothetical protein JSQ81_16000 [Sporosarcina sp. Marseille-Q4063]